MTEADDRPNVYLAGPIQHADDGGHGWRDRVIDDHRSLQYLNPLDFFDGGEDKATILPEDVAEDYETEKGEFLITDEDLVEKDKRMVNEADALLIGFPEKVPAWGTPMEQGYAWENGMPTKPIAVWHGDIPNVELSPWIRYHATFASQSLLACVNYLEAELNATPLCVSCRDELGGTVRAMRFKMSDSTCTKCEDHQAMIPVDDPL